jgi:hypothetical protein
MSKPSILGLGAYAAICMMAGPISAEEINVRCSNGYDLRISLDKLSDSTVNGENRQMEWVDQKGVPVPQSAVSIPTPDSGNRTTLLLRWRAPANASRKAAYFLLDLSKGRLYGPDGQRHERLDLRCTNLARKLAV